MSLCLFIVYHYQLFVCQFAKFTINNDISMRKSPEQADQMLRL
jgi:hypothetical protein